MPLSLDLHQWSDLALLVLRCAVAAIFWVHGRSKAGMWKMQPGPQMPAPMLNLMRTLSIAEPLGALAMLAGLLSQLAAVGFILVMGGAIYMKRKAWKTPFMSQTSTGWELDLLVLASAFTLLILGPGAYSLQALLG
jgi:putative oxidoreductase